MDFDKRLQSLKSRRQGTRERALVEAYGEVMGRMASFSDDPRSRESYELLSESKGVKYAIGAMSEVSAESTSISLREGNRVADSVISGLAHIGVHVEKRVQGSVALNIHIENYSDVDMLIILKTPILVQQPYINEADYADHPDIRPMKEIVKELRVKAERHLASAFPQADVDLSGAKSISISGGSLSRVVDIVPACWHHSQQYQKQKHDFLKGIKIYSKKDDELLLNQPFLHMERVNIRDRQYNGNLKCVIRLLKNIIADLPENEKSLAEELSSYDIASISYHMDRMLDVQSFFRLGLVVKVVDYFVVLINNNELRNSLIVPDESRKVFDDEKKYIGLCVLFKACNELAKCIAKEIDPYKQYYDADLLTKKRVA